MDTDNPCVIRWLKRNTGCFVAGTLVWTAAGAVPIEEVPLGALMLTDAEAAQHEVLAETDAADRTLHVRMDLAEPDGDRFTLESMVSPEEFAAMSGLASELLSGGPGSGGTVFFADFETEGRPLSVEVLGASDLLTDGQPRVAMLSEREGITQKVELTVSGYPHPLVTTVEHPFWSEDRGTWVRAGSLTVGERLRSDVAGAVSIEALSRVYDDRPVYNIEVTQRHNYYVGDGAVLVHNADCAIDIETPDGTGARILKIADEPAIARELTPDEYIHFVRGSAARKKSFDTSWTTVVDGRKSGYRVYDDFDTATGTAFEGSLFDFNSVDFSDTTSRSYRDFMRKRRQIAADGDLLRNNPDVNRVIWFGTQELPTVGPASIITKELKEAGIEYWTVPKP